eukprot:m.39148 g.39148  ORF g.39148 m.39148 type:complete len:399 (+) comp5760_c0_seq1:106-1302(+)
MMSAASLLVRRVSVSTAGAATLPTRTFGVRCMSAFSHANMTIEKASTLKAKPDGPLGFGQLFTDHMLTAVYNEKTGGWQAPKIQPFQNLSLSPASLVFHYGLECFEGMKAYRGVDGNIRLFRPELNFARFNKSSARLAMPTLPVDEFRKCLFSLVEMEKDWIPEGRGYSMYIRPTMIATTPALGVGPAKEAMMFTILSPVGAYYAGGFKPVRVLADTHYVRAWPGGTGDAKCGGNYAATIVPQRLAMEKGCDQVLWLFGDNHQVTEVGTSNFFVHWVTPEGQEEIVTAPLDGTILEGVTRQAVIDTLRQGDITVSERKFTMSDLCSAIESGRIREVFSCGTAVTVTPIKEIVYQDKMYTIPIADGEAGDLTKKLTKAIFDIQYGNVPDHDWAPIVCPA